MISYLIFLGSTFTNIKKNWLFQKIEPSVHRNVVRALLSLIFLKSIFLFPSRAFEWYPYHGSITAITIANHCWKIRKKSKKTIFSGFHDLLYDPLYLLRNDYVMIFLLRNPITSLLRIAINDSYCPRTICNETLKYFTSSKWLIKYYVIIE